jgi:hypothetical protein
VYVAKNPNEEVRMKSSSGGIFSMLAEAVINEGGVVFGARFDENWEVKHNYTEIKDGLEAFRSSKYVQSRIEDTYIQVKIFLNQKRKVLFSGTPCQIAGLKRFLRTEYDNLFTVDVVCHGVPSPLVWRTYLRNFTNDAIGKNPVIKDISFRDKSTGWNKYSLVIRGESAAQIQNPVPPSVKMEEEVLLSELYDQNLFMKLFLKNLCLRPSCYNCPAKSGKSESDLTIADFWGASNYISDIDDDKGISLALIYNSKGINFFENTITHKIEVNYEICLDSNRCIEHSVYKSEFVARFWRSFLKKKLDDLEWIHEKLTPSMGYRIKLKIDRIIKHIIA